jgi:hypothetical protein
VAVRAAVKATVLRFQARPASGCHGLSPALEIRASLAVQAAAWAAALAPRMRILAGAGRSAREAALALDQVADREAGPALARVLEKITVLVPAWGPALAPDEGPASVPARD